MPNRRKESFAQQLVGLICEPEFIRFEQALREPNIFRILGRPHYERWHSCFWGWLLDPMGSHLLSDYVLLRFLLLLEDQRCLKAEGHGTQLLLKGLPTVAFADVEVTPNENAPREAGITGVGRFDIFLTGLYEDAFGNHGRLNTLFELKIDSQPDYDQSRRYADWLLHNHPGDSNLLIYIVPRLSESSQLTVGDGRWYCLDYQLLNDKLLTFLLEHPSLNETVRPFIVQYVKNLRSRYRGVKMAITDEEKKMAEALYDKYSDVLDSIYDALLTSGRIDYSTADIGAQGGRESGRIAVRVGGQVFAAETLRLLMEQVLEYLVDKGIMLRLPLPWGTSRTRYVVTNEDPPKHPNGRDFFYPVKHKGYAMETHYSRDRGIQVLNRLCSTLEVEFERIETEGR